LRVAFHAALIAFLFAPLGVVLVRGPSREPGARRWLGFLLLFHATYQAAFAVLVLVQRSIAEGAPQANPAFIVLSRFELGAFDLALALLLVHLVADRYQRQLYAQARLDPLTQVANRRGFDDTAEASLADPRLADRPMTLAILDLDRFKQVNDTYGHHVGDQVLTAFTDALRTHLRQETDVVGRLGGEEFIVLFTNTTLDQAVAALERFRQAVATRPLLAGEIPLRVTSSAGLTARAHPGESLATLVARADAALYRAKAAGRDRIECG